MEYVEFRATDAQIKELACNIIEACGLERPKPLRIGIWSPEEPPHGYRLLIEKWQRRRIDLRLRELEPGLWSLFHGKWFSKTRRWYRTYPTAFAAVESVKGIEIVVTKTAFEYFK